MRFGSFIAFVAILLTVDILLTIYALSFYGEWIFYAFYMVLAIIVVMINNAGLGRGKEAAANALIPMLLIALLYCTYTLFLPKLYNRYNQKLAQITGIFLAIYLYPLFDLSIYALTLGLGTKIEDNVKGFFSMIHFFMIGYGVGMILIVGYTEVEFYDLLGYFLFRNVFVNHIMRGWKRVVVNPPALPGWVIAYYGAWGMSYMPVVGLAGQIVISKSFSSYIFAKAATVLYGSSNPLYRFSTSPTTTLSTNFTFDANIYWLAGLLIWIIMTFSQRYDRKVPSLYECLYYLIGIYLFYIGIASALTTFQMANSTNAHI